MRIKNQYEEVRLVSYTTGWIIIIVFCLLIIGRGLLNYYFIKDVPRQWDFGILPDTPAESIYSTQQPPQITTAPPQFPALPEANPLKKSGDKK